MPRLPDGMSFKDLAEEALGPIDQSALIAADHPYDCTCGTCLDWWAKVGPDGGEAGNYGPFEKEQVNEYQHKHGLEETP